MPSLVQFTLNLLLEHIVRIPAMGFCSALKASGDYTYLEIKVLCAENFERFNGMSCNDLANDFLQDLDLFSPAMVQLFDVCVSILYCLEHLTPTC